MQKIYSMAFLLYVYCSRYWCGIVGGGVGASSGVGVTIVISIVRVCKGEINRASQAMKCKNPWSQCMHLFLQLKSASPASQIMNVEEMIKSRTFTFI